MSSCIYIIVFQLTIYLYPLQSWTQEQLQDNQILADFPGYIRIYRYSDWTNGRWSRNQRWWEGEDSQRARCLLSPGCWWWHRWSTSHQFQLPHGLFHDRENIHICIKSGQVEDKLWQLCSCIKLKENFGREKDLMRMGIAFNRTGLCSRLLAWFYHFCICWKTSSVSQ